MTEPGRREDRRVDVVRARRHGGGFRDVCRYSEAETIRIELERFSPDNSHWICWADIVYCPKCNEPRYYERLIIYHIDEKHPEGLS